MKLIKILFAIIVLLVITNVTLTNRTVDEGVALSKLSREISELQNQNTIMKATVASAGSLGALSEKIATMGYVEVPKVVSLTTGSSVASR